uniref:Branched-chain amino acid transport system substrate-binding protein n=1 Tax=Candidatus Kentrum sp. SD TaxID=2126332 RepID=A0A451BHM8_9GAMM|nr:MAG: branched-chain amino acid transport system substrate-binding protein [Candidatus Kentron sp. SD]
MGSMSFSSIMDRISRRDMARREERCPNGVFSAFRAFLGSAYMTAVWFFCVLLVMVVAVSRGWAAEEGGTPFGTCGYPEGFSEADLDDSIVVAVAGPLGTEKGREMLRGGGLRVEEVNRDGGIAGKEVVLLRCDDEFRTENPGGEKEKRWEELANRVADSEALMVVGHRSSNASIVAGRIYQRERIPAISGTALADEVTEGNEWYFRTVPKTSRYIESIVYYANKILDYRKFGIIHANSPFEQRLRKSFDNSLQNDGMEKVGEWGLPMDKTAWDQKIPRILRELDAKAPDAVFLAIDDENVLPVIKAIRDLGIDIPILGGAILSKSSFPLLFEDLPKEKEKPGYYTNGIIAPAYFMFDIAGKSVDEFKRKYEERFPEYSADTGAISTYDAMGVALRAIEETYALGKNKAERRNNIREYISGLNKGTGRSHEGAMGRIFFDEEGNAILDVPIAFLWNRQIISAPIQIAEISDPQELDGLKRKLALGQFDESKRIFKVTSRNETEFYRKVNAVYSGVKINRITKVDVEKLLYDLDVYLWFRFNEDPDLDVRNPGDQEDEFEEEYLGNIEFLNAVGKIEIIKEEDIKPGKRMGEMGYSLYRVKGRFRGLFHPESYTHGERVLEFDFRHKTLPRKNLTFVQDTLSIHKPGDDSLGSEKVKQRILSPSTGWEIREITHYLDIMDAPTLGNPELFGKNSHEVEFSRHNTNIIIKEAGISILGVSLPNSLLYIAPLFIASIILLLREIKHGKFSRRALFSNPIIYIVLLVLAQFFIFNWNAENVNLSYLNFVEKTMDVLWWIVLGMILSFAAKVFIFDPLEETTGRKIPTIIPRMTTFTIHLFIIFGIIAFVFDYKITSLLATSGLLAMIIGLAVQTNLSNIFSGIALNLEHPFRIGDWVRIADFDEGKVINVTWRSVKIRTPDNHIISIPNSTAAETVAHNFTPHPEQALTKELLASKDRKFILGLTVNVHPKEEPSRIEGILEEAVGKVARKDPGILLEPEPVIRFLGIGEHSAGGYAAQYEVMVSIKDYEKKKLHRDQLWHGIWNQLNKAGCLHSAFAG